MATNYRLKNNLTPFNISELSARWLVNQSVTLREMRNPLKGQFPGMGNETRHEHTPQRFPYAERSGVARGSQGYLWAIINEKAITLIGKLKAGLKHVWQKPG